jgi:two-component system cell cycle response regulator DivK
VTSASPGAALVLIVDDNVKNLKLATDVLRAAGFRTLEAASGAEAIAHADEHGPDVILLDLRLPDLDGTEVVRELRSRERTARIAVVAVSALSNVDREWVSSSGFDGYIEKPISVRERPDQVRSYVRPRTD